MKNREETEKRIKNNWLCKLVGFSVMFGPEWMIRFLGAYWDIRLSQGIEFKWLHFSVGPQGWGKVPWLVKVLQFRLLPKKETA